MQLTAEQATTVRTKLGLSVSDLSLELGLTPHVVEAWERGDIRVPSHIAKELTWRDAVRVRQDALAASGLPDCTWVASWETEAIPDKMEARTIHLERVLEHQKSCEICTAREKYVLERFGDLPPRPMSWWKAALVWIYERTERLPEWAQPAVWFGLAFGAFSLLRVVVALPSLRSNPSLLLTALLGLTASVSIGAGVGLLVGAFKFLKARWRARAAERGTATPSS